MQFGALLQTSGEVAAAAFPSRQIKLSATVNPLGADAAGNAIRVFASGTTPTPEGGTATVLIWPGLEAAVSVSVAKRDYPADMWTQTFTAPLFFLQGSWRFASNPYSLYYAANFSGLDMTTDLPREGIEDWLMFGGWLQEGHADFSEFNWPSYYGGPSVNWPGWPASPPPSKAFVATQLLACGDESRLVTIEPLLSTVVFGGVESGGNVCATLYKDCRSTAISSAYSVSAAAASHVGFAEPRIAGIIQGRNGYYRLPVAQINGQRVTVYRNGETVLQAIRPTQAQCLAATADDGSYLVVSEVDEPSDVTFSESTYGQFPRMTKYLKDYTSFVIDSRKPAAGFLPIDDRFRPSASDETQAGELLPNPPSGVLSNKPANNFHATEPVQCPHPSGDCRRVIDEFGTQILFENAYSAFQFWKIQPTAENNGVDFTLYAYDPNRVVDRALNSLLCMTANTQPYRIFPWPQFGHFPPDGVLAFPGQVKRRDADDPRGSRMVRRCDAPPPASDPVTMATLTFDRKVKPASDATMLSLIAQSLSMTKDGEPVDSDAAQFTVTEVIPGLSYTVAWDIEQPPRSFFIVTFDPDGRFVNDDIVVRHFATLANFPPVASANYRTVYIADDTELSYSKQPEGYAEIEDGVPLDEDGNPYNPEPVLLASRVGWLMADDHVAPTLIDTSSFIGPCIGGVASVSDIADAADEPDGVSISANGTLLLPATYAKNTGDQDLRIVGVAEYSPGELQGFWPGVPAVNAPQSDCSYFGLQTTLDPCPPKTFGCPFPRMPQRHASAVRCDADIEQIRLAFGPAGDAGPPSVPLTQNADSILAVSLLRIQQPLVFTRALNGQLLEQNTWHCGQIELPQPYEFMFGYTTESPVATLTPTAASLFLRAARATKTFSGLGTTTLGELVLTLSGHIVVQLETEDGVVRRALRRIEGLAAATLSKEKELEFGAGEEISIAALYQGFVGNVAAERIWTIQAVLET